MTSYFGKFCQKNDFDQFPREKNMFFKFFYLWTGPLCKYYLKKKFKKKILGEKFRKKIIIARFLVKNTYFSAFFYDIFVNPQNTQNDPKTLFPPPKHDIF